MIPKETVDKILEAASIVDVIGDFVSLKRRGSGYIACCPFHNEKTPSFSVSPAKGIFKCFGCGKSGTAVGFVMEHENVSYTEALRYLARKYHIEIVEEELTAEEIAQRQRNESLLLVSEMAGKFFQDNLNTDEGRALGYAYFKSRGLTDETIRKFGLGWSMSSGTSFVKHAREAGYKAEFLIDAGLAKKRDDGSLYDRFWERAMFPIHSLIGRVVAFGGRTLQTDTKGMKYVNSPETEIYVKNKSLYGIYFAKSQLSSSDQCILVEGYLDVLSMHQLGITNVVASSGTSLTVGQIALIRKFTHNVTIIYDGDGAGQSAALRGVNLLLQEGMNVKVLMLPDGEDPDSFARKHDKDEFLSFIKENEKDFISFKSDLLLEESAHDPLKISAVINDIADTIALIPDAITRSVCINAMAIKFNVAEDILHSRVNKTRNDLLLAKKKQMERESRTQTEQEGAPLPDTIPEDVQPVVSVNGEGLEFEEPLLEPSERELLEFVLNSGCSTLEFNRDSKYYDPHQQTTVAEFIDASLATDDSEFHNSCYKNVYEEFFVLYLQGMNQSQIQKHLLDNEDRVISTVAKDLLIEKYAITVDAFEKSMTARATHLVVYVPKALLAYQLKKTEMLIQKLMTELSQSDDPQAQEAILSDITRYGRLKQEIICELGRI